VQPILRWKSNEFYIFWVCICRIWYSAYTAHSPYCHQWPSAFAILSSVACPALQYFSTSHNRQDLREKKLLTIKHVLWLFLRLFSAAVLILRRNERDMIKICRGLHAKYPSFLSDFNEPWILSTNFSDNTQIW